MPANQWLQKPIRCLNAETDSDRKNSVRISDYLCYYSLSEYFSEGRELICSLSGYWRIWPATLPVFSALIVSLGAQASAQNVVTTQGEEGAVAVSKQIGLADLKFSNRGNTAQKISIASTIGQASTLSGYSPAIVKGIIVDGTNLRKAQNSEVSCCSATISLAREEGYVSATRADISGPFFNFVAMNSGAMWRGWPLAYTRLSSRFGIRHNPVTGAFQAHRGVDLAAPTGAPVAAAGDGVVSKATYFGSYGLYVAVEHGNGTQSRYAHLSRLNVAPGQKVRAGDIIGFVGSTGRSTGPHLHFEIRKNGMAVDPLTSVHR